MRLKSLKYISSLWHSTSWQICLPGTCKTPKLNDQKQHNNMDSVETTPEFSLPGCIVHNKTAFRKEGFRLFECYCGTLLEEVPHQLVILKRKHRRQLLIFEPHLNQMFHSKTEEDLKWESSGSKESSWLGGSWVCMTLFCLIGARHDLIGLVSNWTLTRAEKPNCVPEAFNYKYKMFFNTVCTVS